MLKTGGARHADGNFNIARQRGPQREILLKSGRKPLKIMKILTFGIWPRVGSQMPIRPPYFPELQESYGPETFTTIRSVMI